MHDTLSKKADLDTLSPSYFFYGFLFKRTFIIPMAAAARL